MDEEVIARQLAEKQQLDNDAELLGQIIELSSKLSTPHEVYSIGCCIWLIAVILIGHIVPFASSSVRLSVCVSRTGF